MFGMKLFCRIRWQGGIRMELSEGMSLWKYLFSMSMLIKGHSLWMSISIFSSHLSELNTMAIELRLWLELKTWASITKGELVMIIAGCPACQRQRPTLNPWRWHNFPEQLPTLWCQVITLDLLYHGRVVLCAHWNRCFLLLISLCVLSASPYNILYRFNYNFMIMVIMNSPPATKELVL